MCKWEQTTNQTRARRKPACGIQNSRGQSFRHCAIQHQVVLANPFLKKKKKRDHSKAVYHGTKHCKQLDFVFMNRAFYTHCKDADTTGHIDTHGEHKAVIARIELPTKHKIQQMQRPTKRKSNEETQRRSDNKINWSEHKISIYQAPQEPALNATISNTTTNHASTKELGDQLENTRTTSASTTQRASNSQTTPSRTRRIRITTSTSAKTQNNTQSRQTNKNGHNDQDKDAHDQKRRKKIQQRKKIQHRKHLEQLPWTKNTMSINNRCKKVS